jgi:hypothetical protein
MSRRFQFSLGRLFGAVGWCAAGSLFGSTIAAEPLDILRVPALIACTMAAGSCFFGRPIHSFLVAFGVVVAFFVGIACLVALMLVLPH